MTPTKHAHLLLVPILLGFAIGAAARSQPAVDAPLETASCPKASSMNLETGTTWQSELARIDRTIEAFEQAALGAPDGWLDRQRAADALMVRARLTGSYDDYARAEQHLEAARLVAPEGGGPILSWASLQFTLHRLDEAAAELDRVAALPPLVQPRPDVLLQRRGALALQTGRYAESHELLQQAVELEPSLGNLSTLALWHWKTGDLATAEGLYDAAEETYHGRPSEPRAWIDLQRGLLDLDRGRYQEALAHYRDAEQDLPGWYLVDEHIAEAVRLLGNRDDARDIYLRVVASTGNPEFMDALADMAIEDGDEAAAQAWTQQARDAYEAQLIRFPEAASGHVLEHFLEFGGRPERALDIARQNHANRPNGEAKTLLAQAALAAGQLDEAREAIDGALSTAWRTADLHAVAADVYSSLQDPTAAAQQQQLALQFNPRALD